MKCNRLTITTTRRSVTRKQCCDWTVKYWTVNKRNYKKNHQGKVEFSRRSTKTKCSVTNQKRIEHERENFPLNISRGFETERVQFQLLNEQYEVDKILYSLKLYWLLKPELYIMAYYTTLWVQESSSTLSQAWQYVRATAVENGECKICNAWWKIQIACRLDRGIIASNYSGKRELLTI